MTSEPIRIDWNGLVGHHAERVARVGGLMVSARALLAAVRDDIERTGRRVAGVYVLFSGGSDSTVMAHMFRAEATHAVHANTGIGIEQTRQFVRDTCTSWRLPLIEEHPPSGSTYEELVLDQGFPGPAHHWKMYQRLKERALDAARRRVIENSRRDRVIFLAGRRRVESMRRTIRAIPEVENDGSAVWVSPLLNWTSLDLNTYRLQHPDCPRNRVSDLLHMSGECLCGAFAKPGELDEIGDWFPDVREHIKTLEHRVRAAGIPAPRCQWGWGAYRQIRPSRVGPMCTSCQPPLFELDGAS